MIGYKAKALSVNKIPDEFGPIAQVGEEFEAIDIKLSYPASFYIKDDEDHYLCLLAGCAMLCGGSWALIPYEKEAKDNVTSP